MKLKVTTKALVAAVAFFPGPVNKLILLLNNKITPKQLIDDLCGNIVTTNMMDKGADGKDSIRGENIKNSS